MTDTQLPKAASSAPPRTLYVVPHTHWDREWYRPFEAYRYRLVRTLDDLLGSGLPYFLLDGQTVVLDDYLALRPEMRETLGSQIRAGKLGVGPWYVLVDEFLVSGESLVRNLLEGKRAMAEFGAGPAVGYLPDMFGHIAQMPQILKGFKLDTAVVWRGVAPKGPRFAWVAPDGSEVHAAWLPLGYYQPMFIEALSPEARLAAFDTYVASFGEAENVWLTSGADHMGFRADLPAQLAEVERSRPGWKTRIAPLAEALAGPRPDEVIAGELRDCSKAYLLPGVLSARTYLKQANVEAQWLLERYAEPLATLAWWGGADYPEAFLRHAWKELMKNHPHDSICGCSIDQVHREMMPRFAAVEQLGAEIVATAVNAARKPAGAPTLFVFNPTGAPLSGWVEGTLHWPVADAPAGIRLVGPDGAEVPLAVLDVEDTDIFRAEVDFTPDWFPVRRFRVAAHVSLGALAGVTLRAEPSGGLAASQPPSVAGDDAHLENERLRLAVVDGRLDLTDKLTGETYRDCHYFLDEGDAGDEYNFSPLEGDQPRRAGLVSARLCEQQPHEATLEVRWRVSAPTGLTPDRRARAAETRPLELTSRFTLRAQSALLEVETAFEHDVADHRLRVVTALGAGEKPAVWAEGAFGVFQREPLEMSPLPVPKGQEATMPEFPQGLFTALERSDRALAFAGRGLHEAALLETEAGWALATTLVRAVGWLSRDDLRTRGGGAGPRFETPEAQCQGPQRFRYALAPYRGRWSAVQAALAAFATPLTAWEAEGPPFGEALDLGDARLALSALKRSEDGRHAVLRVLNPTPEPVSGTLTLHLPHTGVWEASLDETPGQELTGALDYALRPYEIRTWLIEPTRATP